MNTTTRRVAALTATLITAAVLASCGTGGYSGAEPPEGEPDQMQQEAEAEVGGMSSDERADAAADEAMGDQQEEIQASEDESMFLAGLPDPATIEQLMTLDAMDDWGAALVDLARTEYPEQTADLTNEEIVDIGHAPCMEFGEGATLEDVTASTLARGVDLEAGGFIVGAGVALWCAENGVLLGGGAEGDG